MIHRVLIISPHFPPINAPDHQRVRASLPYFQEFGWKPYILTVRPEFVEFACDPLLEEMLPGDIDVIRTGAMSIRKTRTIGVGNLGMRCLPQMYKAGSKLIAEEKIDLAYFSTTMFPVMVLGPRWHSRFKLPYILDFQDPWLTDYYDRPGAGTPPGGRLKYELSQGIARLLEPYAMKKVSHVISVSPAYPKMLLNRYGWLGAEQFTVLPFGAAEKDFEALPSLNVRQKVIDTSDGLKHWVYVGVVPNAMRFALRTLLTAISQDRKNAPRKWEQVKLHFVGTNYYAKEDRAVKSVEPIARELGVADMVEEHTHRVPYFESLKILMESDAILMIGSDDPDYTASKLYSCILARKPILAIFHEQSSVVGILRRCNAGRAVTFASNQAQTDLLDQLTVQLDWLLSLPKGYAPETDWIEFQPYTAREMARRQCAIFDKCISSGAGNSLREDTANVEEVVKV